jgi:formylglycine-generating enzyme required for sulfatase activity
MSSPEHRSPPDVPGYEIHRLIGLGGMGEVHLARQVALNRPVAIKFLTRTAGDPPDEYEARFRREAELMAGISHPNVVTIFDFGTVASRPYLVMEYVEGGDLRSRMVPDLPMKVGEIRAIMKPVLKAVEYLHSRGIVHRDMKPENILMLREETPKVTDFGIAVLDFAMGSLTRTGRSLGTPGYVAPEQQYGLKVDARADQFSLAALCYEMATGRKPLGAFPPPEKLNPKLGPKAGQVILKALSEDPTDRYATIGEFGEALDRGLEAAEGRKSPKGRWRLVAAVAALAVVVALLVLLIPGSTPKVPLNNVKPDVAAAGPATPRVPAPRTVVPAPSLAGPATARLVTKSAGMTLVEVPAGEFWMGSPSGDAGARPDETPRHRVRISRPFFLGETEVTVGQFRKYIDATGNKTSAEVKPKNGGQWGGCRFDVKLGRWEQSPDLNWRKPGLANPQSDDEPVIQVSWYDAVAFCNWLSSKEGRPFRLPTEAEWEYACRAGGQGRWCFGDDPAALDQFAWNLKNAGNTFHPVGARKANAFGLFDMHGNAWEWCLDEFGPYAEGDAVDPQGPPPKGARVLRGGSFDWDEVGRTRSASRHHYPPYMSYLNYGFRVCSPAP